MKFRTRCAPQAPQLSAATLAAASELSLNQSSSSVGAEAHTFQPSASTGGPGTGCQAPAVDAEMGVGAPVNGRGSGAGNANGLDGGSHASGDSSETTSAGHGLVLPFEPITITFRDVRYFVPVQVRPGAFLSLRLPEHMVLGVGLGPKELCRRLCISAARASPCRGDHGSEIESLLHGKAVCESRGTRRHCRPSKLARCIRRKGCWSTSCA